MNLGFASMTSRTYTRRCGKCRRRTMELATIAYKTTVEHDGRSYKLLIPALLVPLCSHCGSISVDEEANRQIDEAFHRKAKLLSAEAIRQGREKLGLTQKQFANMLGVGEAT